MEIFGRQTSQRAIFCSRNTSRCFAPVDKAYFAEVLARPHLFWRLLILGVALAGEVNADFTLRNNVHGVADGKLLDHYVVRLHEERFHAGHNYVHEV